MPYSLKSPPKDLKKKIKKRRGGTILNYDSIKTNYCYANSIKLIRIPFTEYENIDIILEQELCHLV